MNAPPLGARERRAAVGRAQSLAGEGLMPHAGLEASEGAVGVAPTRSVRRRER